MSGDAPETLGTSDVAAVLGLTRDQVRHAVRAGRLDGHQPWGHYSRREYTREVVEAFANHAGITPDWSVLAP